MILSPHQIHQVLKADPSVKSDPKSLTALLENANLTPEEILDNLSTMMRAADSDNVKLSAAKVALQLNGMLDKDETRTIPHVTIILKDSEHSINPILIPR